MRLAQRTVAASITLVSSVLLAPDVVAQLALPAAGQLPFDNSVWQAAGSKSVFESGVAGLNGDGILAADVNNDGYPDILLGSGANLRSALNNGHGVFVAAGETPMPKVTQSIAAGDLDGDGQLDVVSANDSLSGAITTLTGDGTGRFTLVQSQPIAQVGSLALADFDLDGHLDVMAGHHGSDFSFYTLLGLGDASLSAPQQHGTVGFMGGDASDWDLDGDPDVVAASISSLRVFLDDGTGTFSNGPQVTNQTSPILRLADIDGNGWPDAVNTWFGGATQQVLVCRYNDGGQFVLDKKITLPASDRLAIEPDPADGFPDVFVCGAVGFVRLGNGGDLDGGTFKLDIDGGASDIAVGDFDADGRADALVAADSLTVYFQKPAGTFAKATTTALPADSSTVTSLAMAQLDGDARPDLVIVNVATGVLSVAKGIAGTLVGPFFGTWASQSTQGGPLDVRVADADADGDGDAIVLCDFNLFSKHLALHLGDGSAGFGPPLLTVLQQVPVSFEVGDLDGDGLTDAVVLERPGVSDRLRSFAGDGLGHFQQLGSVPIGLEGNRLALGDVNGDGFLDAAATRWSTQGLPAGDLLICLGDGQGRLGPPTQVPQSVKVHGHVVVGDFDADGYGDIATACLEDGGVALFRNAAAGFDAPVVGGFKNATESGLLAADIDDDGALDLASGSGSVDATVVLVRGDGQGGLHQATAHPVSPGGGVNTLAAGDVNLDGMTDLVQLGVLADEVAILLRRKGGDNPWASIGGGILGAAGQPRLLGTGQPVGGESVGLSVDHAAPGAPAVLVLGASLLDASFKGGHLVPAPDLVVLLPSADSSGKLEMSAPWPSGALAGLELWLQVFLIDSGAVHNVAATGGLRLDVP